VIFKIIQTISNFTSIQVIWTNRFKFFHIYLIKKSTEKVHNYKIEIECIYNQEQKKTQLPQHRLSCIHIYQNTPHHISDQTQLDEPHGATNRIQKFMIITVLYVIKNVLWKTRVTKQLFLRNEVKQFREQFTASTCIHWHRIKIVFKFSLIWDKHIFTLKGYSDVIIYLRIHVMVHKYTITTKSQLSIQSEVRYVVLLTMPKLSVEDSARLIGHLEAGQSITKVCQLFNVNKTTVYRLQKKNMNRPDRWKEVEDQVGQGKQHMRRTETL